MFQPVPGPVLFHAEGSGGIGVRGLPGADRINQDSQDFGAGRRVIPATARRSCRLCAARVSCSTERRCVTRQIGWRMRVALIGFGLSLAVLLTELAGRAFHLLSTPGDQEYCDLSRRIGEIPLPYERFTNRFPLDSPEFETPIRLNRLGFRGAEPTSILPAETRRLVLLGDSFTAAWQVDTSRMWSTKLAQRLNQGARRCDVVNLGAPGFGTDREYLLYRAYGRKLRANVVVLAMFVENDVNDNGAALWEDRSKLVAHRPSFSLDSTGELVEHSWRYRDRTRRYASERFPYSFIGWCRANSLTYGLLHDGIWACKAAVLDGGDKTRMPESARGSKADDAPRTLPQPLEVFFTQPDDRWEAAWALSAALLAALRDAVAADGARLVVAIIPPHMVVQNDDWRHGALLRDSGREWDLMYPQQRMLALLDRLRIPALNPTANFVELRAGTGERPFFRTDKHFNDTGHRWFADVLSDWVIATDVIWTAGSNPNRPDS